MHKDIIIGLIITVQGFKKFQVRGRHGILTRIVRAVQIRVQGPLAPV
ncbi:MAG: hypothetical protein P8X80_04755 [Desulfobacterales bacterium]